MAGRGFSPGEKLTADANVGFVFPDGSIMRLAKGSSYNETADCGAMQDKSKNYIGVRGTRFWISSARTSTKVSVSRGSVWFGRLSRSGRLLGRKVVVRTGRTATMNRKGVITVRRSRAADAFPFG